MTQTHQIQKGYVLYSTDMEGRRSYKEEPLYVSLNKAHVEAEQKRNCYTSIEEAFFLVDENKVYLLQSPSLLSLDTNLEEDKKAKIAAAKAKLTTEEHLLLGIINMPQILSKNL